MHDAFRLFHYTKCSTFPVKGKGLNCTLFRVLAAADIGSDSSGDSTQTDNRSNRFASTSLRNHSWCFRCLLRLLWCRSILVLFWRSNWRTLPSDYSGHLVVITIIFTVVLVGSATDLVSNLRVATI